jgi:hypothetical protein
MTWILIGIAAGAVYVATYIVWLVRTTKPSISRSQELLRAGTLLLLGGYVVLTEFVPQSIRFVEPLRYFLLVLGAGCVATLWRLWLRERTDLRDRPDRPM